MWCVNPKHLTLYVFNLNRIICFLSPVFAVMVLQASLDKCVHQMSDSMYGSC